VIISYIDFNGTSVRPTKNDSPLIVDSDAVQTLEVSLESFKPVSWRRGKITQGFNVVQDVEFPGRDLLDTGPPDTFAQPTLFEEPFNRWIGEAFYRHMP